MTSTETKNRIDNEFKRVQIQNHPHYLAWLASLTPYAKQMIDAILEDELTPESILFAQAASEEEWRSYQFVSIIGGGNSDPDNMPALTNFTLMDILIEVREFGKN